jgi:predicted amidohydrolase
MDCQLGDKLHNLKIIKARLHAAAAEKTRLVVFPECILTGYCFETRDEAMALAEPVPGPSTVELTLSCQELDAWIVYGLLERDGDRLFNSCVLVGPQGLVGAFRKIHIPYIGVDRFTTPGDRPFAVHDLAGLKVGLHICYDGSFPESARVMTLMGADLVILVTNWPENASCNARYMVNTRALENTVYMAAVNRVGEEGGFRFCGLSRIADPSGETIAACETDKEEILYAEIDPQRARQKKLIKVPGKHEINRIADRRPEMYGALVKTETKP